MVSVGISSAIRANNTVGSPTLAPNLANPNAGGHPGASIFEANCNCRFANNYPWAYAPRLGMAYQINNKDCRTRRHGRQLRDVARRRSGLSGCEHQLQRTALRSRDDSLASRRVSPPATNWPNISPGLYPTSGSAVAAAGPPVVDQNYGRPSRLWQWNVGLQRELGT